MKKVRKILVSLVLVFALVLSMMPVGLAKTTGIINDDCVRIHQEPDIDSEVYQMVHKDTKLTVLSGPDEDNWVKVSFKFDATGEKMKGYISADYIDIEGSDEDTSKDTGTSENTSNSSTDNSDATNSNADASSTADTSITSITSNSSDSSNTVEVEKIDTSVSSDSAENTSDSSDSSTVVEKIDSDISYTATVSGDGVRIRKSNSKKSKVITTLYEGDIVTVLTTEDEKGWMKVKYYDDEGKKYKGYMSGDYLDINSVGAGITKSINTIVRASADATSEIIGLIPIKSNVDIYAIKDNWYKVEYQDLSGWIDCERVRSDSDNDCEGYGKVTIDSLKLRKKTSRKSDVLTSIPKGVVLQLTSKEEDGKWYEATYNGITGYVYSKYLKITDTTKKGYIQVTSDSLSLRSGAGSEYTKLTNVPFGKVLKVENTVGSWYQVTYNKFTGYINGAFVSATTKNGYQNYPDYAEITSSSLTLRSSPTTDSDALGTIPQGLILSVTGEQDGWYQVTYNGTTGYIDPGYVSSSSAEAAEEQEEAIKKAAQEAQEAVASGSGSSILSYASQFVGNPYSWGGTSLTNGADCSGFVKSVLAHFGISVPHSSSAIRSYGRSVSYSDMQPGDIVCYSGHVGIYAGNGKLLSALGKKYGITYCSVNYKGIITIRRMS